MKVLQVVQRPQRRGAEIFAFQLAQELRSQGQKVQTVYLYPYMGSNALPLHSGDHLLAGRADHPLETVPGFHPHLLDRLHQIITDFDPDVVQVNGARTVKYGAFARNRDRRARWRLIYRNIGNPSDWARDPLRRWFYRRLVMPRLDGVVGVSQATLADLQSTYDLAVPLVCIPNGIDSCRLRMAPSPAEARRRLGIAPDRAVLLFMGSLTGEKRPDRFLRAVQAVRRHFPSLEGWLLGDGPLRKELESQAHSLGIRDAVRFWGYQEEIGSFLAAANLLLVTSDTEGIPAVVLEAGLLGKPTVASRVGGLPECVIDGETGVLVDPKDEDALAAAVLDLLRNPDRRAAIGLLAQEWVESHFTLDKIGQRYLEFYQNITKGDR